MSDILVARRFDRCPFRHRARVVSMRPVVSPADREYHEWCMIRDGLMQAFPSLVSEDPFFWRAFCAGGAARRGSYCRQMATPRVYLKGGNLLPAGDRGACGTPRLVRRRRSHTVSSDEELRYIRRSCRRTPPPEHEICVCPAGFLKRLIL